MFVSSYNTFVQATSSPKIDKYKTEKAEVASESFGSKLLQKSPQLPLTNTVQSLTNNFDKNSLHTKQEILNQQDQNYSPVKETLKKFNGQSTLLQATSAYANNSKMFSLTRSSSTTLNQTPSLDKTLPKEPQAIKEANLRYKMINTYIANDNYYKITA